MSVTVRSRTRTTSSPTAAPIRVPDADPGWKPRPWAGRSVGAAWYGVNLVVAAAVSEAVVALVGRPPGWLATVGWLVGLSAVSCAALAVVRPMAVRLLPLQALLRLGLAFPGQAPSRFRVALRAGNPKLAVAKARATIARGADPLPGDAARTVVELVGALSLHDAATRGHSERVRAYSELIGEELGLDPDARQGLRWAGLVHDVGKLLIPAEILNKAGSLTPEEWEIIRRHPADGARMARPLAPWLGEWTDAVLDHHERWDGQGYPRRLATTDISLAGRVVAVADAYDVMTSTRSYKKPRTPTEARHELVRCAGTQFDPTVVRAFLALSVRKVRAVSGVLPALVPQLAGLVWRYRPRIGRLMTPLVAGATATTVGLLAALPQPAAHGVAPDASAPAAASGPAPNGHAGGALDAVSAPGPNASASDRGGPEGPAMLPPVSDGAGNTTMSRGAGELDSVANAAMPSAPSGPVGPPTAPSSGPKPPAGGGTAGGPATLIVDPAGGSVSIANPGPVGAPPVPVVQAPPAGALVCGNLGVCNPIKVPLPLP